MKSTRMNYLVLMIVIVSTLLILFAVSRNNINDRTELKEKEILLYFADDKAMYLKPENRTIESASDRESLYRKTLNELSQGPSTEDLKPTIPDDISKS